MKINDGCCKCGACFFACDNGAIINTHRDDGFFDYRINPQMCVECGKCAKICPMDVIINE